MQVPHTRTWASSIHLYIQQWVDWIQRRGRTRGNVEVVPEALDSLPYQVNLQSKRTQGQQGSSAGDSSFLAATVLTTTGDCQQQQQWVVTPIPPSVVAPAEVASVNTTTPEVAKAPVTPAPCIPFFLHYTCFPPPRQSWSQWRCLPSCGAQQQYQGQQQHWHIKAPAILEAEAVTMRAPHSDTSVRSVRVESSGSQQQAEEARVRESIICAIVPSTER